MSTFGSTGYGPSKGRWDNLMFNGDERKYEQWEIKMLAYMKLKKLRKTILPIDDGGIGDFEIDEDKNETAFAELIQFLDERSLGLVMRDGVNDGRKSLKILREHYAGRGKPRVIVLYTQLTLLQKTTNETVTDYHWSINRS